MDSFWSMSAGLDPQDLNKRIIARLNNYALSWLGCWYTWGGDEPNGFDCSGFICEIAKAFGALDRTRRLTAGGMWIEWGSKYGIPEPQPGSLVFFGSSSTVAGTTVTKVEHIEYCLDEIFTVGASGGGSKTLTVEDAIRDSAFVKQRPIKRDRFIVGYVDLVKIIISRLDSFRL